MTTSPPRSPNARRSLARLVRECIPQDSLKSPPCGRVTEDRASRTPLRVRPKMETAPDEGAVSYPRRLGLLAAAAGAAVAGTARAIAGISHQDLLDNVTACRHAAEHYDATAPVATAPASARVCASGHAARVVDIHQPPMVARITRP